MKSLEVGKGVFIKKLYFLILFLVCLIGLVWPTKEVWAASSWQVSGAGDASYNGTYTESGTCNGNPQYVLNGNRYLFRTTNPAGGWIWRLHSFCQALMTMPINSNYSATYAFPGDEKALPANPWVTGAGIAPAPTLGDGSSPPPTPTPAPSPSPSPSPAPGHVDNSSGSVDNSTPGSPTSKTATTKTVDNPDSAVVTAPPAVPTLATTSSSVKTGVLAAFWERNAAKVNAVVVALTAALMLAPALANLAFGLSDLLPRILYWLTQGLQMLGLRKKRKPWGVVFNAQTGQAIPAAVVRIFDREYKKMLESTVTDKQGRFGFLVRPGTFYLTIAKTGYTYNATSEVASVTSAFFSNLYTGGDIKIDKEQTSQTDQAVLMNVPLEPQMKASWIFSFWVKIVKLNRVLQKIRIPLMILGTAFAILMIITSYHIIYALSLAFYIILFILEIFKVKKTRPYGVVSNTDDRPLELSIVRIFNKKNDRLVGTDVTDIRGRFKFLVDPGSYYLTTMKPGFSDFKSHSLHLFGDKTLVASDIKMKKN